MNKTTAENFINSLVRNLQALCHSNVEFFDDIEVVGHLYLKVDKSKKFNYIVDEKVSKNDASSTVFVSNSYHSFKESKSKASQCDKDQEKDNQGNVCVAPGPKNVNRQSRSDGEQSKMSMARQDSSEPPYKSQKIFHTAKTDGESKRAKISYKNLAEKMHLYKNSDSDNSHFEIDLTKIKCEPKDENIQNAEFFLSSSPHTSGNVGGSNAIDTGQANEEYHIDYVQNKSSLPLHQSHLDKPSTSSHSSASTNFLSQDMSQEVNAFHFKTNSSAYQVLEMLAVADTSPKPNVRDLAERYQMEEKTVMMYLNQKESIRECLTKTRYKSFVPNRRLNLAEKVQLIRTAEAYNKPSQSMLAKQFGISQPTACRILYQKEKILEEYTNSNIKNASNFINKDL